MTNKYLNSIFALAVACGISSAQAASDWFWQGPTGSEGGLTSDSNNWSSQDEIAAMVFSKDAFDKTIVFDQIHNVGSDVYFGIHSGAPDWASTDEYTFVLKATSSEMGVVAPGKLSVAGWGGAPICRVRIEGGTYTFGDASTCGWEDAGVVVGEGNWGYLDLVSGTITCLNNFWLSNSKQPFNGVVTVGGGDDLAVISVTNKAVTKLRGGDGNSGYGSLTLKANGVFKTNYIVWDNDLATMTFDGGTLVKNGDLSMGQETASRVGLGREGLICGDGSYNNGTARTINITSNGGTIQCDYPVLIESAFALTNDATSAVLTKTGSEKFTWRGNRPGVGLNVQAGTANILASQPLASLSIASGGALEVDCTGCSGDSLTIVPANGTVTLPSGVSASSVVTPVGDGASDYTASYSAEAGLQLLKGVQPTHTHVWGAWTTNTVATETVAGERQHTCTAEGCGETPAVETEVIPATGHIWGEWETTLEPTYTAAGSRERHCSAIDCVLGGTETEEIPMLTHTHVWGEWEVYTPATATEAGERRRYCTAEGCSDPVAYESEVIPATGGGDDPIVDPPTAGKEYHWRGAAPGTSFAMEDAGSPTHACGQWATVSNWTDANGNTMTDYPHLNGDVAIFHGTVNGGYVEILAENVIDISEIRFVEGHTILAVDANAHFSATRMTLMNHATFGYVGTDFNAFTPPNDFVIGNRDDLLVKDGSGNYGLLLGGACYQNWSSGNFANNNTVSLDADGKLVTKVGTENMSIDLSGNDTYSDLGGVIFGQWGDFRGVNYNNDATWTYTVKASSFMHINNYGHIGKAGDKAQGTVDTTGTDCYVWSRAQPAERCTMYVRSKIVNAPTLVVAGFGYTVLFDNHESETCDYCITTGDLRLGGDICNGSTSTIESWTCKLGSGDISVGWYGKLDVACANALNADSTINVSSYNKKGGVFGRINLADDGEVKSLLIDGVAQAAGTYGSTSSGADNKNDAIFSGTGVLTVTVGSEDPVDPPSSSLISTVDGFTIKRWGLGENVTAKDWFERLGKFPDETWITTLVDATNALAHGYIIFNYDAEVFGGALNADVVAAYNAEFTGQFNYDRNGGTGGGYPGGRYNRPDAAYVTVNGQITVPSAGKWTFCVGARANSYVSLSINGTDVEVYETWQSQESSELKFVTVDFPTANATYDVEILQYLNAKSGSQCNADLWLEFSAAKGEYTAFDSTVFELVGDAVTEYTVTFDSNGGSDVAAQTVRENRTATRPTDPTKSGYTFDGWTLNDADYDFTAAVVANITLVAQWSQNEEPDEPTHEHVWSDVWTTNRIATATTSGERQRSCTVEGCTEVQKQLLIATGAPGASVDPATVNRATGDVTSSYPAGSDAYSLTTQETYTDGSFTLPYRLHVPKAATDAGTVKYPLVIFLHGAGERGSDNGNQLKNCVSTICSYALAHGDAYIVAPQCPAGDDTTATWAGVGWGGTSMTRNENPTAQMQAVTNLIYDLVEENPSIDPTRIYVTGISMGGFGTWDIVSRMPDNTFAAMMPVCGGADATTAELYKGETIRFFHGGSDPTVSPVYSQSMDAALTTAGIAHDYFEYEGVDHVGCWADDKAYATANLDWLFGQVRTTVPAEASEDPVIPDDPGWNWTSGAMSSTGDTIDTRGTLVYAYCRQNTETPITITVNGVDFSGALGLTFCENDLGLTFSGNNFCWNGFYDFVNNAVANDFVAGDDAYLALRTGAWYAQQDDIVGGSITYTLKNLTPGKQYLVQIIANWNKNEKTDRTMFAPDSTEIKAVFSDGSNYPYGGYLTGTFTATAETETFAIHISRDIQVVNAIQVRDLSSTPPASNTPPVITAASANPAFIVDASGKGGATLKATATDVDGDPLTYTWAAVGTQPGTYTFATPNADTTTVQLDGVGTYTFRVSVSDGTDTVTEDVSVTVSLDGAVAEVDGVQYMTVEEAFEALKTAANKTLKLLRDASAGTISWGSGNISIDLNGYTLTHKGFTSANNTNIKDGTLRGVDGNPAFAWTGSPWNPISNVRFEGEVGLYAGGNASLDIQKCTFACSDGILAAEAQEQSIEFKQCNAEGTTKFRAAAYSTGTGTITVRGTDGDPDHGGQYCFDPRVGATLGTGLAVTYVASDTATPFHVVKAADYPYVTDDGFVFTDEAEFKANATARNADTDKYYVLVSGALNAATDGQTVEVLHNAKATSADFGGKNVNLSVLNGTLTLDYDKVGQLSSIASGAKVALDFTSISAYQTGVIDLQSGLNLDAYLADPAYIARDYMNVDVQIDNANNKFTYTAGIKPELAEAAINGVNYLTLEEAAAAVSSGGTITVLRDIVYEEARTITIPVEATLDLGGNSITFYDWYELNGANEWRTTDSIVFQQGGAIKNGSLLEPADTVNITDYTYAGNARVVVGDGENTVTLTAENLTVGDAAGHEPFCVFRANKGAKVSISGGTYHAATLFASPDGSCLCYIYGGSFYLRGFKYHHPAGDTSCRNGEFYIYGGAFSLPPDAYYVKDGNVVMHDMTNTELPYSVVPASEAPYTKTGWSYHYTDQAAAEAAVVAKRNVGGEDVIYTSIADAVSAAQAYLRGNWANGGGEDTITLVADVTAFDRPAVADLWTGNNLLIDGAGHTVKVRTPYVAETGYVASDFTLEFPYLFNTTSGNTTMRDIHIMAGGIVDSYKSTGECYAILNNNTSRLKLENVTITRSNGAIMNRDAYLYAYDCRFVRNCRYCAGGIYNYGVAVLERSSLSENRSLASGGGGGAIENPGMLYVNNCVFCNNSSTEIGGAINNYSSWRNVGLYMMNTTIAGNFSAVANFASHCKDPGYEYYGGGIGLRAHQSETFLGVNNLIIDNYQVQTSWDGDKIWTSDISALCETIKENQDIYPIGMTNRLFYSVYQTFTNEANTVLNGCVLELENNRVTDDQAAKNVFNAYYASKRTYQNAVVTTVDINGAQLVSKDDGSLNADLARYAPIKRVRNQDGTYTYGDAVLGTQGVYTYFDASDWTNGVVRMGYAPVDSDDVAYGDDDELEHAGDIVALGDVPLADAKYMVTNYYERIGGRSFGVTGASGWLDEDITYYTVRLAREPENGTASGVTLYGETYADGTTITLTATPGFAREFLGWYIVDPATGTETLIEGSNKTIWELTVDQDYVLVPKFSDIMEYLTPEPDVHVAMAGDDPTVGPDLYPVKVTTKWMTDHYTNLEEDVTFISYLENMVTTGGVEKAEAWLTEILEETDSATGLKMWQDYVLGIEPGDPNGKIWINSPQYMSTGKNLVRMEMNKLTPVKGTKFTINYRLDKKLGAATDFSRADVNTTGSYDVNVTTDPSGLYVIDLLFIPEGKATSEEYVTTVNTAGLLRVTNDAFRAAIAVPWTKLQPTGSSPVSALDLVKTTNLTPGDILYVYDGENADYRAWKMADNGNWVPLNVFQLDEDGLVNWTNKLAAAEGSTVARGLGVWLERANTNDYIYVCGQYESAPVTSTALSKGWNLVGSPSGAAFDLKNVKPAAGDQIIVPTAAEPKTYTYESNAWGYWKKVIIERSGGRKSVQTVRETEDTVVPAGLGFWYISEADGGGTLDWTGAKEEK